MRVQYMSQNDADSKLENLDAPLRASDPGCTFYYGVKKGHLKGAQHASCHSLKKETFHRWGPDRRLTIRPPMRLKMCLRAGAV
jgi:hypothetical protein